MTQSSQAPTPKLYLLTNDDDFALLYQKLDTALATGAIALLQVRRKQTRARPNGASQLHEEARQLVCLANRYQVPVVINDDVGLAAQLGVGVHLGQDDGTLEEACQHIASAQIIGRTCHSDPVLVKQARAQGASYAAMGAVFASSTKPCADIVSYAQLTTGCQQGIDICVIGGLTAENISELAGLPITYVAVVGDIMDLPVEKIGARCQQWQQALSIWHAPT